MNLTENEDYRFIDFKDSELTGIEMLTPEYLGVVFHYHKVRIVEDEGPLPKLQFGYTIAYAGEHDIDDLNSSEEFHIIMGDILTNILMAKAKHETRNDNSKKPNLF
jgi:hypothetical protein